MICDPDICDFRFLFYSLKYHRQEVIGLALGASQRNLSGTVIRQFNIAVPTLRVQKRISKVLSSYDELIENNTRRIAILEEMAQALYREWFVRFPGHELAAIDNDLPQGWRLTLLEAACSEANGIQTGPFGSQLHQSDYVPDGVPVVMPKDIVGMRISIATIARVPESICERLSRHKMMMGDIVYGRRGDIGRKAFISLRQEGWLCGTGCMRLRPKRAVVEPRFLFDKLGRPEVVGLIAGKAAGAIMPNLNMGIMSSIPIQIPPLGLQKQYVENVEPMFELIETLEAKNSSLRTSRDLLLPKLISGQLDVEHLYIDVGEPVTA
jgi:type I restriction enzyme, S subunit